MEASPAMRCAVRRSSWSKAANALAGRHARPTAAPRSGVHASGSEFAQCHPRARVKMTVDLRHPDDARSRHDGSRGRDVCSSPFRKATQAAQECELEQVDHFRHRALRLELRRRGSRLRQQALGYSHPRREQVSGADHAMRSTSRAGCADWHDLRPPARMASAPTRPSDAAEHLVKPRANVLLPHAMLSARACLELVRLARRHLPSSVSSLMAGGVLRSRCARGPMRAQRYSGGLGELDAGVADDLDSGFPTGPRNPETARGGWRRPRRPALS